MPFEFVETLIPDVWLIRSQVYPDQRGSLEEVYKRSVFDQFGLPDFVQDNLTRSRQGVLRGLHFQRPPHAQGKLIYVLQGEIYDVAVDIRKRSPTFGSWVGKRLSSEDDQMMYIPEGFAHGFQVLSGGAAVIYKLTAEYAPEYEAGVLWNDPDLGITWPLEDPILSEKDQSWPRLEDGDVNFHYPEGEA